MSESAEVKIKLVLDDQAHAAGQRVGQDMQGVAGGAQEASGELEALGMAGSVAIGAIALAGAAAAAVLAGIGYAAHLGFEAALEEGRQVKALAGSLMLMSPGASLDQTANMAKMVRNELAETAIEAGVATGAMNDAFQTIAEHSNNSIDEVEQLTGDLAEISKVIPGGLGKLSEAYAAIERGQFKGSNAIIGMIAQMGLLQGNAKQVADQMHKMSSVEQMELADKAIAKMADKVRSMPLGFDQLVESLKDIKDQVLEGLGAPILESVTRVMGDVRSFFMEHKDQIIAVADAIGTRIGQFIDFVKEVFVAVIAEFTGESDDVGKGIQDAMDDASDIWDDIRTHATDIAHSLAEVFRFGEKVFGSMLDMARAALFIMNPLAEPLAEKAGGAIYDEFTGQGGVDPKKKATQRVENKALDLNVDTKEFDRYKKRFIDAATDAGIAFDDITKELVKVDQMRNMAQQDTGFDHAIAANQDNANMAAEEFKKAWMKATAEHNEGALKYGAMVLQGSEALKGQLEYGGALIGAGMENLGSYLPSGSDIANTFSKSMKTMMDGMGGAAAGAGLTMNGGQTFHIKQDFRDADPERVAITFREDIIKAAVNRTQSKLSTSFGV